MTNTKDLYWLAGLLEGEGCFHWNPGPAITLQTTDYDVAVRAFRILHPDSRRTVRSVSRLPEHKPMHIARVTGKRAAAWMMTLYVILSARRQSRIKELLLKWI